MLHSIVITINIIVCSFLAALMFRIDFHHNVLKFFNAEILQRAVSIAEKRKMSAVVNTSSRYNQHLGKVVLPCFTVYRVIRLMRNHHYDFAAVCNVL